ncbi:hypothetical protein C900_05745 [Fulvivirga imtechensis AK7]|uniref:Uncharacterized protein n=2 Tax=Fulvivirga TaxID=396811 RepID=L8JWE7_9BACT|nr:hypothetical protein C900_05745 [Fulvivirga imtechensis AK7]
MKFKYLSLLLSGALMACNTPHLQDVEVHYAGELRKMMHQNDISAKVDLDTLRGMGRLYAIGALDSLKGEILVENGTPYVSVVQNGGVSVLNDFNYQATLLVYTIVEAWGRHNLPDTVETMKDLEYYLSGLAKKEGLRSPFPFRLEGKATAAEYHVIQPLAVSKATHDEHRKAGYQGVLENEKVYITGFYSTGHHGIFTHHNSNLHMHVRNEKADEMGHVDALRLDKDVKLFIPVSL